MTGAFDTLRVDRPAEHLLLLTLDRPENANAFNSRMAKELASVWRKLTGDPGDTRVVVLTGSGNRAFCAGADLKERRGMSSEAWHEQHALFEAMAYGIMNSPIPVIAAINGAAIGGGLELALACDFAYSVPDARFAFTEVTLGIIPGIGGTQNLPRAIGLPRAKEHLMTGGTFTARQALDWGLVNRLCPAESLLEEALGTAGIIAGNGPLAVAAARRAASEGLSLPLTDGLALELEYYKSLIDSEDRREGIAAFNEKRKPRFKGR